MKKEIIITAKTVEEAMSEAYSKYSAEGEVTCEILEMPKKGFLGIGGSPAKIKAVIDDGEDDADISSIIDDMKIMKVETDRGGDGSSGVSDPARDSGKKPESGGDVVHQPNDKASRRQQNNNNNNSSRPESADSEPVKAPGPIKEKPAASEEKQAVKAATNIEDDRKLRYDPATDEEMQFAVDFVETILRDLEIAAKAVPVKDDDGAYVGINIEGESSGVLIGHHGETLDAIQYLANLSASRRSPTPNREFLKITVDVGNYREKREESLRALARRMAAKAVKYKRNFVLEPMNPYERRIIHSEIQEIENVSTHSVGSDDNRKVVVTYEGADKADRRGHQRRRRGAPYGYSANEEKKLTENSSKSGGMTEETD